MQALPRVGGALIAIVLVQANGIWSSFARIRVHPPGLLPLNQDFRRQDEYRVNLKQL